MGRTIDVGERRLALPSGLRLGEVLAETSRSSVLLVFRGSERLVLRLGEAIPSLALEVALATRIRAPGLIPPLEWGETPEGRSYVLRPYQAGTTFDRAVRGASVDAAVEWTRSLLATLGALHEAGVVHRDVKAGNVIVDGGRAWLVDLDLVGTIETRAEASGSPFHVAPEVLLRQPHGPQADLFSLGAMLAFAFCGDPDAGFHQSFPACSFWEAARLDPSDLPPELSMLVRALVRRHPMDRPQTARACLQLLPDGGETEPGDLRLPFLAGREEFFEELAERVVSPGCVTTLALDDSDEGAAAVRELRLHLALRGVRAQGRVFSALEVPGVLGRDGAGDEVLVIGLAGEGVRDLAAELLRTFLITTESTNPGRILVGARESIEGALSAVQGELTEDELRRLVTRSMPRVTEETLEAHLLRLSDGASPRTAGELARSLVRCTDGRFLEIDHRLSRAVAAGVMRPQGSSYALLTSSWLRSAGPERELLGELAGMPDEARRVLVALAILGDRREVSVVLEVAGLGPEEAGRALGALHARGAATLEGTHLTITDQRWSRAALHRLTRAARARIHARAAEALLAGGARQAEIARHQAGCAQRSGDFLRVLEVADAERVAGRPWIARGLVEVVAGCAGARTKAVRSRVALLRARLELGQGNAAEATEILEEQHGVSLRGAPCDSLLVAGQAAETRGRREEARELYERVLSRKASGDERSNAILGLGYSLFRDGDAAAALERIAGQPSPAADGEAAVATWNLRAGALAHLERFGEADAALDRAEHLARELDDPTSLGRTALNRAFVDRRRGRFEDADRALRSAIALFDSTDHIKFRALASNNLGVLRRDLGDLAEAEQLLQESLSLRRRIGDVHGQASSLASLGIVALDAGRLGAALGLLERALVTFTKGGYARELAFVGVQHSLALALAGRGEEARERLADPARSEAAAKHPHLFGRAQAACHLAAGEQGEAVEVLRKVGARTGTAGEASEQYRVAAWLFSLEPGDRESRESLEAWTARLGSVRGAESRWLTRHEGERPGREELAELLGVFEHAGRTDLVRAVALELAAVLDREGRTEERRRVASRAREAEDALVDSLPAADRGSALACSGQLVALGGKDRRRATIGQDWLLAWNRRMLHEHDLQGLLLAAIDMALEVTGARRGFLVLLERDEVAVHVARGMDHDTMPPGDAHLSETVVREAVRSRVPVVVTDARTDSRFSRAESVKAFELRSVLCVPLQTVDGVDGAIYVDNDRIEAVFDEIDTRNVQALADQAAIAITHLRRIERVEGVNGQLREQVDYRDDELAQARTLLRETGMIPPVAELVGDSPPMRDLHAKVDRLASAGLPVLISGPSGSGRALVARALHERSERSGHPFLSQNAAALPVELFEREFFGQARGAGGATRNRRGLLARANGGTLFLEEIHDLPLDFQPKLLRALDSGEFRPLGAGRVGRSDVRLLASTHRDLRVLVRQGRFDRDLYHAVHAVEISVPGLNERVADLPQLIHHYLAKLNAKHGTKKAITDEVVSALVRRPWAGEMRELSNEIARLYFLAEQGLDRPELVRSPSDAAGFGDPMPASYRLEDVERAAIARALEATRQRKEHAARLLGISRAGLYTKMRRLGMRA